jgi:DNA polymerase-3 subunit beta
MKVEVEGGVFAEAMSLVKSVLGKQASLPVLSCVLLEAGDQRLRVRATDLERSVEIDVPAVVAEQGVTAPNGLRLASVAALMAADGVLTVTTDCEGFAGVSSKVSRYQVTALPAKDMPERQTVQAAQGVVRLPATVLLGALRRAAFAASFDEARYSLNTVRLQIEREPGSPPLLRLEATDGHRLARVLVACSVPAESPVNALVPRPSLAALEAILKGQSGEAEIAVDATQVMVRVANRLVGARLVEGQFPDVDGVIRAPRTQGVPAVLDAKAFADGLRRMLPMANERNHPIKVVLKPEGLQLEAATADAGEAAMEVPVQYVGERVTFGMNAAYLLDWLNHVTGPVVLRAKDAQSPVYLKPDSEPVVYEYVVMPMRI